MFRYKLSDAVINDTAQIVRKHWDLLKKNHICDMYICWKSFAHSPRTQHSATMY